MFIILILLVSKLFTYSGNSSLNSFTISSLKSSTLSFRAFPPNKLFLSLFFVSVRSLFYSSIRRTDYGFHMDHLYGQPYVDSSYFIKAMKYYKEKYNNVYFVVATDDMAWAMNNIDNSRNDVLFLGSRGALLLQVIHI